MNLLNTNPTGVSENSPIRGRVSKDTTEAGRRIVATRSFRGDSAQLVVATVFEPTMVQADKWSCCFTISGLITDVSECAYGVDSMQALMMSRRHPRAP